jgi:hypothetical protein
LFTAAHLSEKSRPSAGAEGASDQTHNGWANYPTWAVNLWLSNDEHSYRASRGVVDDAGDPFRGGADLKEWVEDRNPLGAEASLYQDLLGWALQIVDWEAVARSLGPEEWAEEPPPESA